VNSFHQGDAAASPSPFPSRANKIHATIGYYALFVTTGLTTAALGPTVTGLAQHTQSSLGQISILFTARALGNLLGSIGGGRLFDRLRGHPLMAVMVLGMGVTLAVVPTINRLWLLTLAVFLVGITKGTLDVGGNTLLVWQHGRGMGPFMNGLHFFWGVGAFLFPIFVAQSLLRTGDINESYWLLAILTVPAALWLVRLPSPRSREVDAAGTPARVNTLLLALLTAFFFLYVGAEASFHSWIFSYATAKELATETQAAYLTSVFWATFTIGRLLSIPIAFRVPPRIVLTVDLVACIIGVGMILLVPASTGVLWLGAAVTGLGMASVFPTAMVLTEHRMTITGKVTSALFVGASAGGMILPWLIGQGFERIGPGVTLTAIILDVALALVVLGAVLLMGRRAQAEAA
jgi:MFS transporter, FHS family, Na+ dependent glucose transporter 1